MRCFHVSILLALLFVPAAALAAQQGEWSGPYAGVEVGSNQSSANPEYSVTDFSGSDFATAIYGGYDWQLDRHIVLGGDIFYLWNAITGHIECNFGSCLEDDVGSNVYGLDGRIGFPFGYQGQFMPYVKAGYGHFEFTGDFEGDADGWRLGTGIEWRFSHNISLMLQYIHAEYDVKANFFAKPVTWKNDNYTVGINWRF
ncbi:MAG: porin family protein [Gammaproteobacteria bacterium]|nr:porin family protein [Gammaproteobacteria bacterium]